MSAEGQLAASNLAGGTALDEREVAHPTVPILDATENTTSEPPRVEGMHYHAQM